MQQIFKNIFSRDKRKIRPVEKSTIRAFNAARGMPASAPMCYAPYNNMNFNSVGRVNVCCENYRVIDHYEGKSIREIWTGPLYTELRQRISAGDLGFGCEYCATHIENGNFSLPLSRMFDRFPEKRKWPGMMEFELSNTCNLECAMCIGTLSSAIRRNREKLPPLPEFYNDTFIRELDPFLSHLSYAVFNGGEPFLIPAYREIWKKMLSANSAVRIAVTTNGTVLNDAVLKLMDKGRFDINLSLESLTPEIYEKIRKNAVFQDVMENFRMFHQYSLRKNTAFWITACPQRLNWHEMPQLVLFCNQHAIEINFQTVMYPWHVALWSLPAEELKYIHESLSAFSFSPQQVYASNVVRYNDLVDQVRQWSEIAENRNVNGATPKTPYVEKKEGVMLKLRDWLLENDPQNMESRLRFFDDTLSNFGSEIAEDIMQAVFSETLSGMSAAALAGFLSKEGLSMDVKYQTVKYYHNMMKTEKE
jgi:molybdenum cofactor biosynthesis enzyme MoaA